MLELNVQAHARRSLEDLARQARYGALHTLCAQHQISHLCLAQHRDDQAETVLLQLLRGSGLAGLSGMPEAAKYATMPKKHARVLFRHPQQNEWHNQPHGERQHPPAVVHLRPLLPHDRAQLEVYAQQQNLSHIEDESNQDVRIKRNALRHLILPLLNKHFPHPAQTLARSATHMAQAHTLLHELAQLDAPIEQTQLLLKPLRSLSDARLSNVLRAWLAHHGLQATSQAKLQELLKQVRAGMPTMAWLHDAYVVQREGVYLCLREH